MNYESRDTYGIYTSGNHLIGGPVSGQYKNGDGPGPRLMGAETLIGNSVVNLKDEDLGEIKEIMLDVASGRVSYAVLSYGSILGMGAKLFAVPWSALSLDTVNKCFVLDSEKDRLADAPGFDSDRWPDMADSSWINHLHTFYGTKP